jgi:hypothetical protein
LLGIELFSSFLTPTAAADRLSPEKGEGLKKSPSNALLNAFALL